MIASEMISEEVLPRYQIFDVRSKAEWRETGVIPGALLLPFNLNNGSPNPNFISLFKLLADPSKDLAFVCASGFRSAAAARLVSTKLGLSSTNLKGGMYALLEQGFVSEPYSGQDLKQALALEARLSEENSRIQRSKGKAVSHSKELNLQGENSRAQGGENGRENSHTPGVENERENLSALGRENSQSEGER